MAESDTHRRAWNLDAVVASDLAALLERYPSDSVLKIDPSASLLSALEVYFPHLLAQRYPEWESESLDGFHLQKAHKVGANTAEFAGLCILISDQTVTPVFARLTLGPALDSIASYQVFLGEPGGGRLNISGPPINSSKAEKLLEKVGSCIESIHWSYVVSSDVTV